MSLLDEKFERLAIENAPGQEVSLGGAGFSTLASGGRGRGAPVDFSHGNVDAFEPTPGSLDAFLAAVHLG